MEEFGESSALMVPLISRERVIGVLELTHREPQRSYSDEETATIVSICRFAALAIDNAELYEGIKGMHLSNLKALSSALNAKDYYTLGHAARVAAYMALLGRELGWPDDVPARRRGGGLPARHRQDRRAGPGAAEAERAQRARVAS